MKLIKYLQDHYGSALHTLASANERQLQALLNAIVLVIAADSRVDSRELLLIRAILEPIPPLTAAHLDMMLPDAVAYALSISVEGQTDALRALRAEIGHEDLLEICYILAVACTMADGVVVDFETRVLAAFQAGFDLHPHLALRTIGEVREALA